MKIVIATPLYPPDIAPPAPYVKELASRLKNDFNITVVTYGLLKEKVSGVEILTVDKSQPTFFRLLSLTRSLFEASKDAKLIYLQNGPSAELPALIVSILTGKKIILNLSDQLAHEKVETRTIFRIIENLTIKKASHIVEDNPLPKPEIIPFEKTPQEKIVAYNLSWEKHLDYLKNIFNHA